MRIQDIQKTNESAIYRITGERVEESEIGDKIPAFEIRRIPPGVFREMQDASERMAYNGRRLVKKQNTSSQLLHRKGLVFAVTKWWNLEDEEGSPLELDEKNLVFLDKIWSEFSKLWQDVAFGDVDVEAEIAKDEQGN